MADDQQGQGGQAAQQQPDDDQARWLIYSREHKAFWRALECGYTTDLDLAGRYTWADAGRIVRAACQGRSVAPEDSDAPEVVMLAPEASMADAMLAKLSELDRAAVVGFLCTTAFDPKDGTSHGTLDAADLVRMLLQDVALLVLRPGSWEGHGMAQLLAGHGYHAHQADAICEAIRGRYWGPRNPYKRT